MPRILIIDDERAIRNTLREVLEYENYIVDDAEDGVIGLEKVKNGEYDVIFCDIKMPKVDGVETLIEIVKLTDTPVIMITGHGTVETAVECLKKGAYDFISKPLDLNRIIVALRNAIDRSKLIEETKVLKKKVSRRNEMIGSSKALKDIKDMIARVAPTNARVLITGENGTGKELVARSLHEQSNRSGGAFIEVNCAAIPSELIESQLFGHEKGSFTSAIKQKKGDFELATGGTLFLDEIGDMSFSVQAKVLRALQENKITRVGGEKDIPIDVRVVAATNKDLREEIENKRFREDLYHRLSVILIRVPALRERKEDIELLVNHFVNGFANEEGKAPKKFTKEAISELQTRQWTGNIRELKNVVERLLILCDDKITKEDIIKFA